MSKPTNKTAKAAKAVATVKTARMIKAGVAAALIVILMVISCVVGLIATGTGGDAPATSPVDAPSAASVKKVEAFEENAIRTSAVFTDAVLKRVCGAALAYKGGEGELETIANTLGFESIVATDEKGKITDSYPEDLKGKSLKDNEDTLNLTPVAKNITGKAIGTVKPVEGTYQVTAAAKRTDREEGGAIAATMLTDTYAEVAGVNLAADCGENVIIEKNGERLSSSFTAAGDKSIDELGVKENDKATDITVDGKSYTAKAAVTGEYRVMTAVEAQAAASSGGNNPFVVILITNLVLAAIGVVVTLVIGKKKA